MIDSEDRPMLVTTYFAGDKMGRDFIRDTREINFSINNKLEHFVVPVINLIIPWGITYHGRSK